MPNQRVWQAHLNSPQEDPAGATGPPVTPVTPGPSGLSSAVSVFCPFCVRQKRPEADRKACHRLRPLAHARPAKAPLCGFPPLQASVSSVRGALAPGQHRGQSTMGRRSFSSGSQPFQQQATARETNTDRRTDGGKAGASFGFHISGSQAREPQVNKQLTSVLGPRVPGRWPPSGPGGEGRPRKQVPTEIFVSKRREWLDCVFSGGRRPGSLRTALWNPGHPSTHPLWGVKSASRFRF